LGLPFVHTVCKYPVFCVFSKGTVAETMKRGREVNRREGKGKKKEG
jgi:hypothetical protein